MDHMEFVGGILLPTSKRPRCSTVSRLLSIGEMEVDEVDGPFGRLPDECVQVIFSFLPSPRDRCSCAAVSKKWLLLLAHLRGCAFRTSSSAGRYDAKGRSSNDSVVTADCVSTVGRSDGDSSPRKSGDGVGSNSRHKVEAASRCLEATEANDARVAAMAVGTYADRLLGELSVRGDEYGGLQQQQRQLHCRSRGITDSGLETISQSFPNLRSLSLWGCPSATGLGLAAIARSCPSLRHLDVAHCSRIDDLGFARVAEGCPDLVSLAIDSCPRVGNGSLLTFAKRCGACRLESVAIARCPLIDVAGVAPLVSDLLTLTRIRLSGLRLGDGVLEAVGKRKGGGDKKGVTALWLENVSGLSAAAFNWVLAAEDLRSLAVRSCAGFADGMAGGRHPEAPSDSLRSLTVLDIRNCRHLTDGALTKLTALTTALETLKLDACPAFTAGGLARALRNCSNTLKVLSLTKCNGVGSLRCEELGSEGVEESRACFPSLDSLTLKKCCAVGDAFLSTMAPCCSNIKHIGLVDLPSITDGGVAALLQYYKRPSAPVAVRVTVSGCMRLTDRAASALSGAFRSRLRSLSLEGCSGMGDPALEFVMSLCPRLTELDVSGCSVSDTGVMAMVRAEHQKLEVLSLAGCNAITDQSLACLEVMCIGLVGLNLKGCRAVTPAGIKSIRSTLWWCDLLY